MKICDLAVCEIPLITTFLPEKEIVSTGMTIPICFCMVSDTIDRINICLEYLPFIFLKNWLMFNMNKRLPVHWHHQIQEVLLA